MLEAKVTQAAGTLQSKTRIAFASNEVHWFGVRE